MTAIRQVKMKDTNRQIISSSNHSDQKYKLVNRQLNPEPQTEYKIKSRTNTGDLDPDRAFRNLNI